MNAANADQRKEHAVMQAEATRLLGTDSALMSVIPEIARAIEMLHTTGVATEGPGLLRELGRAITGRLRTSVHGNWPDYFHQRLILSIAANTAQLLATEMAIGAAAGSYFGNSPGEVELDLVDHILRSLRAAYRPFDAAAVLALRDSPKRAEVLDQTLRTRIKTMMMTLEKGESTFSFFFGDLRRQNSILPQIRYTWKGGPRYQTILLRDAFAYDLLRRVDGQAYVTAIEALPNPSITQSILDTAGQHAEIPEICELLCCAAPAFDHNGVWVETSIVPFLLLSLCTEKLCTAVVEPNGSAGDNHVLEDRSAAKEIMPKVLDALTARSDGIDLGYAWLQYLIWSGRSNKRWSAEGASSPSVELLTVLHELGSWLRPRSNPEEWVAEEDDFWRNERIYTVLQVLRVHQKTDNDTQKFIETVLLKDLVHSHGVERLVTDAGSHERHIIGSAIGDIADTASWFKKLWTDLFRQRDRARLQSHARPGERDPPNVGKVAVMWGLCGLDFVDANSDSARELWLQLEAATRESVLMDSFRLPNDGWSTALRRLAAHWPAIFSDDPPAGSAGSLDDFISFWSAPSGEFALLIAELRQRGVTIAQLKRSMRDGQTLRYGARALAKMRGVSYGPGVVSMIESIAADLDC